MINAPPQVLETDLAGDHDQSFCDMYDHVSRAASTEASIHPLPAIYTAI